jgi:uncharacterized protein
VARFWVLITPRAAQDRIDGVTDDGLLRVRVRAAPVDGAANAALVRLLAEALTVPRTAVVVERGGTSRRKRISAEGVGVGQLAARWPSIRSQ